jgi:hypothetical protein
MQDWNSFHNPAPARGGQTELVQLESRSLVLPTPASHVDCRSGPFSSAGSYGKGPVFGDGGGMSTTSWGVYFHNLAYADTTIDGPILIRANDPFTHQPVVFVGQYAAGPVVGHDTVDGVAVEQRTELVFDASQASKSPSKKKFAWPFVAGVPNNWSGSTPGRSTVSASARFSWPAKPGCSTAGFRSPSTCRSGRRAAGRRSASRRTGSAPKA